MTPYPAPIQSALKLGFSIDSFVQSSILNGSRVWTCGWSPCSHPPFSRKDRAVAHVARVHIGTKIYRCGSACGNPKWYVIQWLLSCTARSFPKADVLLLAFSLASFVSKDNLHAHINPVYTQCSSWCVTPSSSYFSLNHVLVPFRFLRKTFEGTQKVAGVIAAHQKSDWTDCDCRFRMLLRPIPLSLRRNHYYNVNSTLACA